MDYENIIIIIKKCNIVFKKILKYVIMYNNVYYKWEICKCL